MKRISAFSLFLFSSLMLDGMVQAAKIQDDTVSFNNLKADCVYGNYKMRCTAWGYRTLLQTTVRLISDELVSCVSQAERSDRCWWGVYASPDACCNDEEALKVQQQGTSGYTCYCSGDMPLASWIDSDTRSIIQAHSPSSNLCLSINDSSDDFEECNSRVLKSPLWRIVYPEEVVDNVTISSPTKLYHLVWANGLVSYYSETSDDTTTTTTSASTGLGISAMGSSAESSQPTLYNCLKSSGTDIQLGTCSEDKGYNDESLLWEVIVLTSDESQATGFSMFRASSGNKCMTSLSNTTVGLRDCDMSDETQWYLLYDVDNNEQSAAYDEIMKTYPDDSAFINSVGMSLLVAGIALLTQI